MGVQNCFLRVQRHFLRTFFQRIILIGTVSEKIQLVLSKLHSTFPGNFSAKQFSKSSIWFFSSRCQIFQAWVTKTVFNVSRGTFRGIFFHRIILIDTVSKKSQLVLSELHFTFPGNFWAKQLLFFSPCQIVQAWVTKTVFYVSRGIFAELFSQNHINCHCERKKNQLVLSKLHYIFAGNFWAKQFSKSLIWFFSSPCQNLQARVAKTVFYVSRGTFCGIFSQNHINWHCERKNTAGFVKTAFYFCKELLQQNNSRSHRFGFFLVLARFFKHGLPKLSSTCPEALFAEFFSENHNNWQCERKNSAGFVKTAFYFCGELLNKTILEVVDLVFF